MIGQGFGIYHGLRTPREEIAFNAWPKIQSQSQFQVRPKHILSATWAQFFRYLGLGVCSPRNLYLTFMPAKRLAQKCLIFSLGICVSHIFNNEHFLLEVLNANRRVSFRHLRSYIYWFNLVERFGFSHSNLLHKYTYFNAIIIVELCL